MPYDKYGIFYGVYMDKTIKDIVIIGGGSAGWLTAGILAKEHSERVNITLIESPQVATIGVGEGTWPSMRNTLERIGIKESDFLTQCDASFKQGSQFIDWLDKSKHDKYYHPFMTPDGYGHIDLHAVWHSADSRRTFADTINHQSAICQCGLAPKQASTPQYAAVTNYGYHLDATKFSNMLQAHCVTYLKVNHILAHITEIQNDSNDFIECIHTSDGEKISGDLFIDCSGATGLLIDKHYGISLKNQQHILFNDRAIAAQVPYSEDESPIEPTTLSTAKSAGWIWDIGLTSRRGTGYVYSSNHLSDCDAKKELTSYIAASIGAKKANALTYRTIKFTPGYREKFWHKNCVAIGMSSGFIEPLEASALAMVELSISYLSEQLPSSQTHMGLIETRFNQQFEYRWQRVIEFLKLHYVLSKRDDSQYWVDNRNEQSIPKRLQALLALWKYQPPSRYDLEQQQEIFPSSSYQYILYGMGFKTEQSLLTSSQQTIAKQLIDRNQDKIQQCIQGLPANRALLQSITKATA